MVFMGDQSLPTGYKKWGNVENCLPFYCHQGEGGHKDTKELGERGGYQVNFFVSQPNSFNERKTEIR